MLPYDVRNFTDQKREELALRIQASNDFNLPNLKYWNYDLCKKHRKGWMEVSWNRETKQEEKHLVTNKPFPGCRECGIHFFKHQRVGIMWLYMKKRALLADPMGTGKTTHAAGLIAMLAQTGELRDVGRVVIVPRAPALGQWNKELLRMIPALNVVVASGSKKQRINEYAKPWHTLLISPQTLINDIEAIKRFPISLLVTDDVDAIRNPDTKTSWTLKNLGMQADRMVIMTGTPLQKRLRELWSTLEPIGGLEAFGTLPVFEANHTRPVLIRERDERTGLVTKVSTVTGYKSLDVVKQKMAPMILRRRIDDLDDINMPEVMPSDVFLELYPRQQAKYEELRQGVLSILKEEGMQVKHVTAMSRLIYGAQICGGLASLGESDDPETSIKMDWILDKLGNELEDEKVVIFAQFKNSVHALHNRLRNANIGYETIWGEDRDKASRMRSQERFWQDPNCKVIIGTQAIEQSLNLQVARHLINMDMILNPARMSQLAGRIRRSGSVFRRVFVHNLLTVGTQEERYLPLLEREAALASHIWDESSELFNQLSAQDMLRLITG